MLRTVVVGVLAMVVAGCGSTASSGLASQGSGPAGVAGSPSDRPTVAASATPTPTPTPLAVLGEPPTAALDAATMARLQAVLDGGVAAGNPDMIAAVLTADGAWAGAAGVDGPDGRKAVATDEFGIASVSKVLLAALVFKLAEQGKLDLDAPLSTYLDGIDVDANGATVRQAVAMRSGIGGTIEGSIEKSLAECDRAWSTADIVGTIPAPFASPDTTYNYSNPTYKLLGFAAEKAAGMPLEEAFRTLVLDGVDADRILLQGPEASPPKPWALPIEGNGGDLEVERFGTGGTLPCLGFSSLSRAASAFAADAPTLARWGWELFAGNVVSAESLAAMTTTDSEGQGVGVDRLLGFSPEIAFGHGGNEPGYRALLAVLPERQAVVVVLINKESADPDGYARELIKALDK